MEPTKPCRDLIPKYSDALAVSEIEKRFSDAKNSESIPKVNLEGVPLSLASGKMVPPQHEANNNQDLPSAVIQPCKKMLGNIEKVISVDNSASANKKELNKNLKTGINLSGTDPHLKKLKDEKMRQEEEERRKARKRQLNAEACRRSRIKKKKEYEEIVQSVNKLRNENSGLKKRLRRISKEYSQISQENDTIMKELVEKYGEEAIADLIKEMPNVPESII